jgi:hypothetical protein
VVTSQGGGGSEAAIFIVCRMEVGLEDGHGFVAIGETTPFAAGGDIQETFGVDDVVALADDCWQGLRVLASCDKANAVFKL